MSQMNRSYDLSISQKVTFALGHFLIVIICAWLIFADGLESSGKIFSQSWSFSDYTRTQFLFVCAAIYWVRHVLTLFYVLKRKVEWSEVFGLLLFIGFIEIGLVLLGGGVFRDYSIKIGILDLVALILYLVGSLLNSLSEIQRKHWKDKPENKGHCYTGGLFRYSIHINYFGDVVLFTGWCLFTYNYWSLALPLFMGAMFAFYHIPGLDSYLSDRYGEEFKTYALKTKKLIPFIY